MKPRNDIADPKWRKSSTDSDDPRRDIPKTDIADPKRT
jgi:hypothetical protein